MPVESMRTESDAVYEVIDRREGDPPGNQLWARVHVIAGSRPTAYAYSAPGRAEVAGMYAASHPIGTRMRVKTTTVAKIEKPKKAKAT